jgi:hypothetical protein
VILRTKYDRQIWWKRKKQLQMVLNLFFWHPIADTDALFAALMPPLEYPAKFISDQCPGEPLPHYCWTGPETRAISLFSMGKRKNSTKARSGEWVEVGNFFLFPTLKAWLAPWLSLNKLGVGWRLIKDDFARHSWGGYSATSMFLLVICQKSLENTFLFTLTGLLLFNYCTYVVCPWRHYWKFNFFELITSCFS